MQATRAPSPWGALVASWGWRRYSFVRTEQDVRRLQQRLAELGAEHLGIVLKIETRQGFENLPGLLFAAGFRDFALAARSPACRPGRPIAPRRA